MSRNRRKTATVSVIADDGMIEKAETPVCGHVNQHYCGSETLTCELPAKHNGDHECDYPGGRAYWNDAAGYPHG